jgi:hypothetical protein
MAECYNELRAMAYHALRFRPGDTLQPTSVVHEVFLKLRRGGVLSEAGTASLTTLAEAGATGVVTEDQREHFLALASRAMRQVLGDAARRRARLKRSAPGTRISIADLALGTSPHTRASMPELRQDSSRAGHAVDVELLDRALTELQRVDPRAAELVELRFFGGMPARLGVSRSTAEADWRYARAWLASWVQRHADDRAATNDAPRSTPA